MRPGIKTISISWNEKYFDTMDTKIYDEILKRGVITEREINLIKRRMNRGASNGMYRILRKGALQITPEQTQKGIAWLMNLYQTPKGAIRKNNPFSKKQAEVLKAFRKFEFIGFIDCGTWVCSRYYPAYRVWPKHGKYFDYVAVWHNQKNPITIL